MRYFGVVLIDRPGSRLRLRIWPSNCAEVASCTHLTRRLHVSRWTSYVAENNSRCTRRTQQVRGRSRVTHFPVAIITIRSSNTLLIIFPCARVHEFTRSRRRARAPNPAREQVILRETTRDRRRLVIVKCKSLPGVGRAGLEDSPRRRVVFRTRQSDGDRRYT